MENPNVRKTNMTRKGKMVTLYVHLTPDQAAVKSAHLAGDYTEVALLPRERARLEAKFCTRK
jgi:hypothetical protein